MLPSTPAFIRRHLPKPALISLVALLRDGRHIAAETAERHSLAALAAVQATGYMAHLCIERRMREEIPEFGGRVYDDSIIPGTSVRVHQVVAVFDRVIVARATLGPKAEAPRLNATRRNAAQLNFAFDRQLVLREDALPSPERCFVLLLTTRDPADNHKYARVEVAVLESDGRSISFREDADAFIAGYEDGTGTGADDATPKPPTLTDMIELKRGTTPFVGSEHGDAHEQDDTGSEKKGQSG